MRRMLIAITQALAAPPDHHIALARATRANKVSCAGLLALHSESIGFQLCAEGAYATLRMALIGIRSCVVWHNHSDQTRFSIVATAPMKRLPWF